MYIVNFLLVTKKSELFLLFIDSLEWPLVCSLRDITQHIYKCTETVKLVWCIELCRSYVELLTNVINAVQFLFNRQTRSLIQSIILKLVIVLEMKKICYLGLCCDVCMVTMQLLFTPCWRIKCWKNKPFLECFFHNN